MTKRLSTFDKMILQFDSEIAVLQLARQKLIDQQAKTTAALKPTTEEPHHGA